MMFSTVAGEGSNCALSKSFLRASMDTYSSRNSVSVSSALLISCSSFSVVSWYKYLIRSFWVKVFIIGKMVFNHFLSQVDERITHSSQRSVDADICPLSDFLKTHFQIGRAHV